MIRIFLGGIIVSLAENLARFPKATATKKKRSGDRSSFFVNKVEV
jgi:hypothetical protein